MIIKSKYKPFGLWFSISALIFGISVIVGSIVDGLHNTPVVGRIFLYFVVILMLSIYGYIMYCANLVTIDTDARSVSFVNIFTRRRQTYAFEEFDGKIVWDEPIRGGYVRNFYFIKNKRAVKKLSTFMYANQPEMEAPFNELKDFGTLRYTYVRSWKVFFGVPIVE